jgi:hypothetical protein
MSTIKLWLALATFATIVGFSNPARGDKPRAMVVVVAKDSKVTGLSMMELKRCFSGDAVVVADQRLIPFNYPAGSTERIAFDRAALGMSPEEVGRFWVDRKIRGESSAPHALPSAAHVKKIVAKFPGAIAYLPIDELTGDVRAIALDGVRPGASGYPIMVK